MRFAFQKFFVPLVGWAVPTAGSARLTGAQSFSTRALTAAQRLAGVLTILILILAMADHAPGAIYTFTTIAESSGPFGAFTSPAINAGGTVAFRANLDAGGTGIFTGSGGPTITIADTGSPLNGFSAFLAINTGGTVAFSANLDAGGNGIFTGSGGPITTIADTSGPFSSFGNPAINTGGTVAFRANLDTGGPGIFTGNGGPTTTIAHTSGAFSSIVGNPAINTEGTVAFNATLDSGGSGIFIGNGGPTTTIVHTSGPFSSFASPVISTGGTVAFRAGLDAGGFGIFTGSGGPTTMVADDSGPFMTFASYAINTSGTVAFIANLNAGGTGIFTGPDASLDKIIRTGDPLDGSTVIGLTFDRFGLNDAGAMAFHATLDDGRSGIYRADLAQLATVPEPASLTIWSLAAMGCAMGAYRRRRGTAQRP